MKDDDAEILEQLRARGVRAKDFPCLHIAYHSTAPCSEHPAPVPCPDRTIIRWRKGWAIPVFDGGSSFLPIDYCPWCGVKLSS